MCNASPGDVRQISLEKIRPTCCEFSEGAYPQPVLCVQNHQYLTGCSRPSSMQRKPAKDGGCKRREVSTSFLYD